MTTRSDFGQLTNGSEVAEVFSDRVKGRTFVITGVSPKSLGGTLASVIARQSPARLILASRSSTNLEAIAQQLKQGGLSIKVDLVVLDLASLSSVREAAATILRITSKIDVLINTAAVSPSEKQLTKDGIEIQFGVAHVGHFLLTNLLLPQLKAAAASTALGPGSTRIINVSSHGHRLSPVRLHDYNFEGKPVPEEERPPKGVPAHFLPSAERPYHVFTAYGQSKTANILHSMSLTQRLEGEGIRSYALHPGSIKTDLSRNLTPEDAKIIDSTSAVWVTPDQGTSTILVAALDPALDQKQDGIYLADCQFSPASRHASDPAAAAKLWELSEKLTESFSSRL